MISSIRSQSMTLRSSDGSSFSGIAEASVIHRTCANGATGVSPSPGWPGGGGRSGRGRTGRDAATDPSIGSVYARGDGARGLRNVEDGRCGGVGGNISSGRCGRAVDGVGGGDRRDTGTVCGGDHAGGGDLGRVGGAVEGRGCRERPEVAIGGDFGTFGRGRDLPKGLEVGLIWVTIAIKTSNGHK